LNGSVLTDLEPCSRMFAVRVEHQWVDLSSDTAVFSFGQTWFSDLIVQLKHSVMIVHMLEITKNLWLQH